MKEVCTSLAKIEPSLEDIASNSKSHSGAIKAAATDNTANRKRKASGAPNNDDDASHSTSLSSIPKKRNTSNQSSAANAPLTASQREEKALNNLIKYIIECGGEKQQVSSFRCKVVTRNSSSSGDQQRYETTYYNDTNRKFRSMVEVARFLNVKDDNDGGNSAGGNTGSRGGSSNTNASSFVIKKGRPRNMRELEAEQKKLRKELDKLVKAHGKATKAMDDFHNEKGKDIKQIDDDLLLLQNGNDSGGNTQAEDAETGNSTKINKNQLLQQSLWKAFKPDSDDHNDFSFPGIPSSCTQDLLMVWDFLCTFSKTLSLEPIDLDNFVAALNYVAPEDKIPEKPRKKDEDDEDYVEEEAEFDENKLDDPLTLASKLSPPIYLAEAHIALMKLLLKDVSSERWWWSILETPELEALELENATGRGEADNIAPTIKVDLEALLNYPDEDIAITRQWLQALEDVREKRTNSGGAIKSAVKSASSITQNQFVKSYLRKSLLHWQGNAASFTKQSVMWLIGRVREARPDLWGRKMDQEALAEQMAKVAREAEASMAQLEDAPELDDDNMQLGDSEDEDTDSDDDENNQSDEDTTHHFNPKKLSKSETGVGKDDQTIQDEMTPVTTPVPATPSPTLVDLLLPPSKPLHNSQILCPFTWPTIAGASVCRIIHRFKRLRNEVDDSLREFRDLSRLTIKERLEREKRMTPRVFTECVAALNLTDSSIDDTVSYLCKGGNYLVLGPLQRLCILRILIEAAYDTDHIYQCVQDNITSRKNAVSQLEKEEKNARKAAKESAVAIEQAARQRLAQDALDEFMMKKRREISRTNKHTNEFTQEMIDSLTVEEIIDMDEDNRTEYDVLPSPQQFSKAEVSTMVTQITEENAFDTTCLEVLTVEEIETKEETILSDSRKEAIESLKDAIEDGTIKALKSAIRIAKNEYLCGENEEDDGMWTLDLLRDAALELKQAEKRKKVTEAKKDLVAKRNKCFVRKEELGSDRFRNTFWRFDQDLDGRIWLEGAFVVKKDFDPNTMKRSDILNAPKDVKSVSIGAPDEESDFCAEREEEFLHFSRQEYDSSGLLSTLAMRRNNCVSSCASLRGILKHLDARGVREGMLKSTLKELVEASGGNITDSHEPSEEINGQVGETGLETTIHQDEIRLELINYRNKMGRFCGRVADAPYAASPLFLGKLILKREQDCYMPLKNRTYENNWGGKNGARNAWIASMKEHANNITAVRDGLLTLEDALFEMCGGFKNEEAVKSEPALSGKELLENRETRSDIELESSVQTINGLWNSKTSRLVFREIISSKLDFSRKAHHL